MDVTARPVLRLLLIGLCLLVGLTGAQDFIVGQNQKVCRGTSSGLVGQGDSAFRYKSYRAMYENCTHVSENLEIVFLELSNNNYDMTFLQSIEEVLGYVLLVGNTMDYIPLTSLRIIRGKTVFMHEGGEYSLFVALNYLKGSSTQGLKELRFTSLTEILNGKVYFNNNNMLCYENTIDWSDINPREKPAVQYHFDSKDVKRQCGECHPDCFQNTTKQRHCWGEGASMCQQLTEGDVCHASCEGRCYGKLPNQCCHPECAGGCVGPKRTDCFACRNFQDEGECVAFCPLYRIYDSKQLKFVINPNVKYTYGSLCVNDCPKFLVKDEGACVRECSEGKFINDNQTCTSCEGPCPRTCDGTYPPSFIGASNIDRFKDCTIIKGPIRILISTFEGDPHKNVSAMHPSRLKALNKVQTITEYLMIQSNEEDFQDLSFLSTLRTIQGMETSNGYSLTIVNTKLRSLNLVSLETITNGNVMLVSNMQMCFAESVGWDDMFVSSKQKYVIAASKPKAQCEAEGRVCHNQCKNGNCWGAGPEMCRSCANMVYKSFSNSTCLNTCQDQPMLYNAGANVCKECHTECNNTCSGPKNTDCDSCEHVTMLGYKGSFACLGACPESMYPDDKNICRLCHRHCEGGCTGPSENVGPGGCNSCEVGIRPHRDSPTILCLPKNTDSCERGFHLVTQSSQVKGPLAGKRLCELCDPLCLTCNGPGVRYCEDCNHFRYDSVCTKICPQLTYGDNDTKHCTECDVECRGGCHGPSSADCDACTNYKIYIDEERTEFNCTFECPEHLPYKVQDENSDDLIVCADLTHPEARAQRDANDDNNRRRLALIVGPSVAGVLVLGGLLVLFGYFWHKRAKANEKTAALTARMTGFDETEPLTPTNAKPDLAQLRLIKESELRRGGIIGSGAFGTVYKGFWIPEGENVKIPVAIKVLQEGAPNQNKELLEEARVMASVEHPCCIRILAVCMTAQMMLITQLMPLGCLLDYVRKNKDHIGSKVLLNWCTQIAKGMTYLEERGIVHRDLAARNVLVQTPNQVKITDFGLAKLLDFNEEEYHAAGGKMPIKWLALECIQHRIFTHKSDVWSYGVTVWELFTYGQKPYDTIRARDVPDLLEKGERLPQPYICTIDVYMIMIKCWMLDADSRPSFRELAEEFAKMARDPGRYLVIQGDVLKKMPEETVLAADMAMEIDTSQGPQPLQGDKLMRLPSHSYDKQDLVRSLSVAADGDEEVVEADDYLQPQVMRDSHDNNNSPHAKMPLLPEGASNVDCVGKLPGKEIASNRARRDRKYAHLDAAEEARQQRQLGQRGRQDSSARYCSDPVKVHRERDEFCPEMEEGMPVYHEYPMEPSVSFLGTEACAVRLPVDEDNYLKPRASNPTPAYTDLNDKVYYQNEKQMGQLEDLEEDGLPMIQPNSPAVANPEYFESDLDPPTWTRPSLNGGPHSPPPQSNSKHHPNYYNDLTHLTIDPREAEPLMDDVTRPESTV